MNGAATNGAAPFDRAALTDHLISLVEDRTGYPRDMLGMDQNLEADLGIDSIKRVEIVGALLKWLPAAVQPKTADLGEALNAQKTLNGILDLLWSKIGTEAGGPARPFDLTGADAPAARACARPPRFLLVAHAEELPQPVPTALPAGTYVITDDGAGVAPALAELVTAAGGRPKLSDQSRDDFVRGFGAQRQGRRLYSPGAIRRATDCARLRSLAWRAAFKPTNYSRINLSATSAVCKPKGASCWYPAWVAPLDETHRPAGIARFWRRSGTGEDAV